MGEESALEARTVLHALRQDPGPLVVGAAQGASYLSAAYELALALDTMLRREKLRDRIPITFVTAEPYRGQLGFGQTAARPKLERLFAQRTIEIRVGVHILQVQPNEVTVSGGETLPARATMIMPPFTGASAIWKSAGLTNPRGMIAVTEQYQHLERSDVYAAGVASSFAKPVPPLGGYRAPHTAYLSLRMGKAAGQNVTASLGYGVPPARPLPEVVDVRVLDGGDVGLFLLSRGTRELRHHALQLPGRAEHLLKASIERYVLWQLRTGRMHLP